MTSKWPKIDFSDFSTMNIENNYNKVYIARNYIEYRV